MPDNDTARLRKLIELLDEVAADSARLREQVEHSLQRHRQSEHDRPVDTSDLAMHRRE